VSYGTTANNILCTGTTLAALPGTTGFGCDSNWNTWWLGSRTQWNITKDFYMGVDVLYQHIDSATLGVQTITGAGPTPNVVFGAGGSFVPATDYNNWSFRFRVHRDFYP
jgi:hypothetical protein